MAEERNGKGSQEHGEKRKNIDDDDVMM